ncbi:CoA-binding domain-containing protein [Actinoplanes sp. N902-109]|nr:CoA-binding domain-containing protein [Actinoplanes sp. N902-109]
MSDHLQPAVPPQRGLRRPGIEDQPGDVTPVVDRRGEACAAAERTQIGDHAVLPAHRPGHPVAAALPGHRAEPVDRGGDPPAAVDLIEGAQVGHRAAGPPERVGQARGRGGPADDLAVVGQALRDATVPAEGAEDDGPVTARRRCGARGEQPGERSAGQQRGQRGGPYRSTQPGNLARGGPSAGGAGVGRMGLMPLPRAGPAGKAVVTMTRSAPVEDPPGTDVLACDGGVVTIRPVRSGDRAALAALQAGAGAANPWLRFRMAPEQPAPAAGPGAREDRLTVVAAEGTGLIGVACAARLGHGSRMAEVAVFVASDQLGRGIGTLLLEDLAARAPAAGIAEFVRGTPAADGAGALRPLLAPRSVAVVGAGPRHGGAGHEILRALRDQGFRGRLYAVNPAGHPVCGLPAGRSVAGLPEAVDLVVVAVRAELVPEVLIAAGHRGVRSAVVLSKGFGTGGPAGRRRRAEVLGIARRYGLRLLGPGSIGVLGTDPGLRLNACLAPVRPPAGGLAVAAQSAAVGIALLAGATRSGCGISSFVSLGEQLDVGPDDLIAHWYDDPGTRAVALQLEGLGDPRRFARTVRALGRRKPVLAVGSAGLRAAQPELMDALFDQAGVIRTAGLDELLDAARLLVGRPPVTGTRLAIVGNADSLAGLAADRAEAAGFIVSPLTRDTRTQLPRGRDNPVVLPIDAGPAALATAAEALAGSGEIDILLPIVVGTRATCPTGMMAALGEVADNHPGVTVAAVLAGGNDHLLSIGARQTPVYPLPEQAIRALGYAHRWALWQRQPLTRHTRLPGIAPEQARMVIGRAVAAHPGWLHRRHVSELLAAYGITLVPVRRATTGGDRGGRRRADRLSGAGPPVLPGAGPALGGPARADRPGRRPRGVRAAHRARSAGRGGAGAAPAHGAGRAERRHPADPAVRLGGAGAGAGRRRAHRPVAAAGPADRVRRRADVARSGHPAVAGRARQVLGGGHRRAGGPAAAAEPAGRGASRDRRPGAGPGAGRPGRRHGGRRPGPAGPDRRARGDRRSRLSRDLPVAERRHDRPGHADGAGHQQPDDRPRAVRHARLPVHLRHQRAGSARRVHLHRRAPGHPVPLR